MFSNNRTILLLLTLISVCLTVSESSPEVIKKFYENILSESGSYGQITSSIEEIVHKDYEMRPNDFNLLNMEYVGSWGLRDMMIMMNNMLPGLYYKPIKTILCSDSFLNGDKIAVHFKIGATIGDLPEEMKEYPMFPGQDPDKMKGKTFETTGLHFHVVQDGKIKKTWCIVDWSSALSEIGGGPKFNLLNPPIELAEALTEIPTSISGLYEDILQDTTGNGRNISYFKKSLYDDLNSRPNPFNPTSKSGFGAQGLMNLIGMFTSIAPDFHFERKLTWLCHDQIALLSRVTATIKNIEGFPQLPMFPGIPSEKLLNKTIIMSALDLQTIRNGKIKQELHIENYPAALHQMLNDEPEPDFGFNEDFLKDPNSSCWFF